MKESKGNQSVKRTQKDDSHSFKLQAGQYLAGQSIGSTERYRAANVEELEEALMHHPFGLKFCTVQTPSRKHLLVSVHPIGSTAVASADDA